MTECSRCGRCCEDIVLPFDPHTIPEGNRDPERDGEDLGFIQEHWHRIEDAPGYQFSCDQFDPETRLCTAHDSRPPVCRDYPWYNHPREEWAQTAAAASLAPQCSFNADVRTMLPIVAVIHR